MQNQSLIWECSFGGIYIIHARSDRSTMEKPDKQTVCITLQMGLGILTVWLDVVVGKTLRIFILFLFIFSREKSHIEFRNQMSRFHFECVIRERGHSKRL